MAINHCSDILIRNVKIIDPTNSPTTDGIQMQSSTGVTITSSSIMTGEPFVNRLGDHLNEEGVQNVTVTSSSFTNTQNGVRIKLWARQRNGYARNIAFRNIIMNDIQNPIIIDRNYCSYNRGCPHQ
ncbi:hypothetical protein WN944_015681 [Citrus x changshan-huyou]|uniref:Polygalacturonase n=1 Tax=Citrus x changshan-huyou TaxID=2935761 RepID=A0AAP0M7Z9_9ROSI